MTENTDEGNAPTEGTWRDRALERSLRTARAKAMSRSDRFIATAMEILAESGRSDFTVQELVDRSRTSLRSFYQYFSGKDELLLALLEESINRSVDGWREEIAGQDTLTAIRTVIGGISGNSDEPSSLNRGMAPYHFGLVEAHTADYQHAIAPLVRLLRELIDQGVIEGALRSDIPADRLTRVLIRSVLGSALFTALAEPGSGGSDDAGTMWEFCRVGLLGAADGAATKK